MLFTPLFLLAAMAPAPTAVVDTTRAAFTKCLREHLKKSLEAKITEAEYEISLKAACEADRAAFRNAVIALDRAMGSSTADATESGDLQVEDYHYNFADKFKDYSESNTVPG